MKREDRNGTAQKVFPRCAIYTRVSTDSGLEQEFNSLDNQREASEAYIKSQAHEGWKLIRDRYDDGGFSGGSMDRPALKKLLDDVRERRVDVIVVYKVDRLTRSLADFAKLVELFDAHSVSFVSVTQAFNTTTSMGRLTLNVLLSFAQFEREVTGERIRDKIAASKKKGMWMGGVVPLGYRVEDRALHVVEEHAAFVRTIFRRYLEIGSVVRLKAVLDQEDVRLPFRIDGTGKRTGGGFVSRGHLYKILSNPIYIGRLAHKGQVYAGLHVAILDAETWDRVQSLLATQAKRTGHTRQDSDALLAGKLFDDRGHRMSPNYATKGGRRWRYYVSQAILQGRKQDAGSVPRLPAAEIEGQVAEAVRAVISVPGSSLERSGDRPVAGHPNATRARGEPDVTSARIGPLAETHAAISGGLGLDEHVRRAIERVTISQTAINIQLTDAVASERDDRNLVLPWMAPSSRRRREIIHGDGEVSTQIRPMRTKARLILLAAIRDAHRWLDELMADPRQTVEALASREGKTERSIRLTLSLSFVAPTLLKAAIEGRLPRGFGVKRLMDLPTAWSEQWTALALKAPAQA